LKLSHRGPTRRCDDQCRRRRVRCRHVRRAVWVRADEASC
jgi:hypothetical protein